jgi:hypothetical protein
MFADDTACADADADLNSLITRTNTELKKIAFWFRANKMVVNIIQTKYIISHNKGKSVDIVYDDNKLLDADPHLVVPLERYHSNHENPDCRTYKLYKLLGIYLMKNLTITITPTFSAIS